MAPRDRFLSLDGLRLHYLEWGDPTGPPMLLLHGGRGRPLLVLHPEFGAATWFPYHDQITARFRVLAPDHLGFGKSERPEWLDHIDDLLYHYLDLLDLHGYVLMGSPRTVRDRLKEIQKDLGVGIFIASGRIGDMSHDRAIKSAERFAREVIPYFRHGKTRTAKPAQRVRGGRQK